MLVEQPGTGDLVAFVTRYLPCSACQHAYSAGDVAVLRHSAGSWVLSATCPVCHHNSTFSAFDRLPYTHLPGMGAVHSSPLSQDDVQTWADFLVRFQGDLSDLLAAGD